MLYSQSNRKYCIVSKDTLSYRASLHLQELIICRWVEEVTEVRKEIMSLFCKMF